MAIRVQEAASVRLDEISVYTRPVGRSAGGDVHQRVVRCLRTDRNTRRHVEARAGRVRGGGVFLPLRTSFRLLAAALQWRHRDCHHPARANASDRPIQGRSWLSHCRELQIRDRTRTAGSPKAVENVESRSHPLRHLVHCFHSPSPPGRDGRELSRRVKGLARRVRPHAILL